MVDTIEVKRKYTCDCCHCTHVSTDGFPFGWISINGYEPDNNRLDPTIQLCPTCAIHAYRQITSDKVLSVLNERLKDESCICYSNTLEQLQTLMRNDTKSQKDTATHEHEDKSKLLEASRVIEGYFDCLADDGFPITPWSDAIVCIPADTKHYEYDLELEEFKETGEYTNYACLVKIKSIMQKNGIVWGSIANGAPDELTWFNLTRIKDSFTICDAIRAEDCLYKTSDDIVEPLYVETYYYDPKLDEFFNSDKNDMGGLKNITITATSIAKIEDSPVALVKIRCRDDEDFTGKWIKFSDLVKMN